ncbi:MAG: ADP-ribosylation factor-like protein [Acidithiobacillales bacterium]
MALFNHTTRDLTAKIVFYGPGLCGKTTNLSVLHRQLDRASKGKLLSLATAQDRTIYFDLLPVELGNIKGYTVRFQLCTVPGQVFYNETRKVVLRGVDGVVFVVDSQASMLSHNLESFQNLRENLRGEKIVLETIPVVVQYNKRDLPSALPIATMQEALGFSAYPFVEAVASEGRGVVETFRLVSKLTFVDLLRRLQKGPEAPSETAAAALVAATETVPVLAAPETAETVFSPADVASGTAAGPAAVADPVASDKPPASAAPVVQVAAPPAEQPANELPPAVEAEAEGAASPVFEEFESDGEPDGWSATLDRGFPGIDVERSPDSSPASREQPAATDLATTRAIETSPPVVVLPPTAGPTETVEQEPAAAPEPTASAAAADTGAPASKEVTTLPDDETRPGRLFPDEREALGLEESLTRALKSISEESARREEVETRLGGRIANMEEELSALRRELAESRSREDSLRSLTEAMSRRWESLRRILSDDGPPPA